ncbi:MAG: hydrogenase maturation nickel metallochaperone HypA [Marinilabiliaceae bacterium]|nr:hydrogenase maturation nickel metallochaperone HypA [Marinilabiliaceae bacterium]
MHELTLANNILQIINQQATLQNDGCVREVEVVVGELSGVMIEALKAALQAVIKGTNYENTLFNLTEVKAIAECTNCSAKVNMETLYSQCPQCHNMHLDIMQGKELFVKSITFE